MIASNRLEGLRDIARYYADLVEAGRVEYIISLFTAQRKLKERAKKEKEKANIMGTIKQAIQARIKHNEARLEWKKAIDFTNMSHAARGFTTGQSASWVSEIYFLKGLLEGFDKGDPTGGCEGGGCEDCSGKGECHH